MRFFLLPFAVLASIRLMTAHIWRRDNVSVMSLIDEKKKPMNSIDANVFVAIPHTHATVTAFYLQSNGKYD